MMLRRTLLSLPLLLLGGITAICQVPATDLYLFDIVKSDTTWHVHAPKFLSDFNKGGYTNQPEFITDDLLYVSVRKTDQDQNDIYGLHLTTGEVEQITNTPEGEYSPTLHPDGESFTCIREILGDEVNQQLFKYPLDRNNNGTTLFSDILTVGYHCWMGPEEVALFLVGDPVRLSWANVESQENKILFSKIGRALRRTPSGQLAYVHKYNDVYWYLKVLDDDGADSRIVAQTLPGCEDFTVLQDGSFIMGKDSELYILEPGTSDQWRLIADLSIYGVDQITRLASNSRGQIALVSRRAD